MIQEIIKWDLSDYYTNENDPSIEKDIKDLEVLVEQFAQNVKGKIESPALTSNQLLKWYKDYEVILENLFNFETYSELLYRTNNNDDKIKSFHSKIGEFKVKIKEKILFFDLELNRISDSKFQEIIQSDDFKNYWHALKFNRSKKSHQLSEKEEQIILMKDITGVSGFLKLYGEVKANFTFDFEVEGEIKKLTEAELFSFMYQQNKNLRQKALQTMMSEYKKNEMVFTHIFNNILKDWNKECKKRNYLEPISKRNQENEVSDESVAVLGRVTTESYPIVEKYYNLKKKCLILQN